MEIIEKDSIDNEDIPNILEFVTHDLPIANYCQFGVLYNKKVFNGWVKQPRFYIRILTDHICFFYSN